EVAGQRNAHPRTGSNAVHHGNGWLSQLVDVGGKTTDPAEVVEPLILRRRFRALGPRPGQIGARTKAPAVARKDRHPDLVISTNAITCRVNLVPQCSVQGVQLIRPIERHGRNVLAHIVFKAFEGHGAVLLVFSNSTIITVPASLSIQLL